MNLSREKMVLGLMLVITLSAIGGVAFAYALNTPMLAVSVSFVSVVFNLVARVKLTTI